jgi:Zn-dependent M28 family amino/carboxypeptidase
MIGRNRDNDPAQHNTVFVIGADRISTDLHNLVVDTNASLAVPLTLDYEYNDPSDLNSFYTRSDHYSYASKGIPIAFFFTGTHPDYHANSDSVEKILFDKQAHVAQLVYQTGFAVANTDRTLERDNRGARSGRGFSGRIAK